MGKEKGILLSEKFGVNPCLTICSRCGGETNEILLLGKANKYECKKCHKYIIGTRPKKCPFCEDSSYGFTNHGEFEGTYSQRLPASELCDKCKKELREFKEEIAKGGVPWKCDICKSEGVIKSESNFARNFRKEHSKAGIILDKDNCPVCSRE